MPEQNARKPAERQTLAALALLVAGFLALRVATGRYDFWFDEYASLIFADQPVRRLWSGWMARETNPPLFYTLLRGWEELGFVTRDQLRLLPELGGALQLGLLAWTAWLGWGRRAAIAAVVLAGLSPQFIHMSQLLRGYVFAGAAVTLSLAGLLLVLREPGRPARGLALYVAGAVLAVHFHTTMLLWPPVASLALLATCRRDLPAHGWRLPRYLAGANLAIAALCAWWLSVTLGQMAGEAENTAWIGAPHLRDYVGVLRQSVLLTNDQGGADRILSWIVAGSALAGATATWRDPATRLVVASAVLGTGAFVAASLVRPVATGATLFWLSTFTVLLIAGAIGTLRSRWMAAVLLVVPAAALALNFHQRGSREQIQPFATVLRQAAGQPGTELLVEKEAMAAVTARACKLEFPGRPCPVPIITLASTSAGDSWARGLGPGRAVTRAELPAALWTSRAVIALRTDRYDPLLTLGMARQPRLDWTHPFSEGPVPAERFRAR